VEKLGSMTPEELEAIPGIGPQVVEKILVAVNAYYAQFEPGAEAGVVEAGAAEGSVETVAESPDEGLVEAAPEPSETEETASVTAGKSPEEKEEFDTIKNSEGIS
jgi:hypothetical protein